MAICRNILIFILVLFLGIQSAFAKHDFSCDDGIVSQVTQLVAKETFVDVDIISQEEMSKKLEKIVQESGKDIKIILVTSESASYKLDQNKCNIVILVNKENNISYFLDDLSKDGMSYVEYLNANKIGMEEVIKLLVSSDQKNHEIGNESQDSDNADKKYGFMRKVLDVFYAAISQPSSYFLKNHKKATLITSSVVVFIISSGNVYNILKYRQTRLLIRRKYRYFMKSFYFDKEGNKYLPCTYDLPTQKKGCLGCLGKQFAISSRLKMDDLDNYAGDFLDGDFTESSIEEILEDNVEIGESFEQSKSSSSS